MFCSNCGKEVPDNAYVCTGCGCLVGGKKPAVVTEEKTVDGGGKNKKLSLFVLLSVAAIVLTLFFFTSSMVFYEWELFCASFIMSTLLVLPAGIIGLVFGIKEKQNAALKLIASITFIVCIAVFITIFNIYMVEV